MRVLNDERHRRDVRGRMEKAGEAAIFLDGHCGYAKVATKATP